MSIDTTSKVLDDELAQAMELLRNRLDRRLVDSWIAARGEQDWPAALLDHLRTRETPRLLFSPGNAQHIIHRCRELDPDEFAWEQRIADEAVAGRVYAASNPYCDRFVELDRETFDFSRFDHWDRQALMGLNRHRWYSALARHYWVDQGSAYFDALMREWDFYAEKVAPPDETLLASIHSIGAGPVPPYGELDVSCRLTNWWWAYWLMLHAEPMTPERNAVLLARCLQLFDRVAARGIRVQEHNFTSMQMEAIYFWATALPEATGMDVWRHAARNNLEASLRRAVAEDGSHWEQSIGYHQGGIRWYGASMLLARRNGRSFADGYAERLQRMGEFLDALITPDGNLPLLSDSDRVSIWKGTLAMVRCLFPEQRFRHDTRPSYYSLWVSDGFEWEAGETRLDTLATTVFPQAGLGVMRHRDDAQSSMVILDNGPNHAGHAHMDNLNVHFEASGRPVLVDPGRWIYVPGPDRSWVLDMCSHNTISIEDEPIAPGQPPERAAIQHIVTTDDARVSPIEHKQDHGIARLSTSFKGYTDDVDAQVQRTLWFPIEGQTPWLTILDQFESPTSHTWTSSWLLPSQQPVQARGRSYTALLENGLTLRFATASSEPLSLRDEEMFWCPNYAEKSPARWLRFSSQAATGQRAFVFAPGDADGTMPKVELNDTTMRVTIGETVLTHEM